MKTYLIGTCKNGCTYAAHMDWDKAKTIFVRQLQSITKAEYRRARESGMASYGETCANLAKGSV